VFGPPFHVVHNQLFCHADSEGEVVYLVPHCKLNILLNQ
jgi:hypothetical protein